MQNVLFFVGHSAEEFPEFDCPGWLWQPHARSDSSRLPHNSMQRSAQMAEELPVSRKFLCQMAEELRSKTIASHTKIACGCGNPFQNVMFPQLFVSFSRTSEMSCIVPRESASQTALTPGVPGCSWRTVPVSGPSSIVRCTHSCVSI